MNPTDSRRPVSHGERTAQTRAARQESRPLTWAGAATFSPAIVGALVWAWLGEWQWGVTGLGVGLVLGMCLSVAEQKKVTP